MTGFLKNLILKNGLEEVRQKIKRLNVSERNENESNHVEEKDEKKEVKNFKIIKSSYMSKDELKEYLASKGLNNIKMFSIVESDQPNQFTITINFNDKGTYMRRTWIKPDFRDRKVAEAYKYTDQLLNAITPILERIMILNETENKSEQFSLVIKFN